MKCRLQIGGHFVSSSISWPVLVKCREVSSCGEFMSSQHILMYPVSHVLLYCQNAMDAGDFKWRGLLFIVNAMKSCIPVISNLKQTKARFTQTWWENTFTTISCLAVCPQRILHMLFSVENYSWPNYCDSTYSILWLLMPWLLASPGHQHPWYSLCRVSQCGGMIWIISMFIFMFPMKNLTRKGLKCIAVSIASNF